MVDSTFETDMEELGGQPAPIVAGPIFAQPPRTVVLIKYLFGIPGYFLPMNILYMGLPVVSWFWLTPDLATMKNFQWDWIANI